MLRTGVSAVWSGLGVRMFTGLDYLDWGTGWSRDLHSAGATVVACLGEELYFLALAKAAEAIGNDAGLQVISEN